MDFWKMLITFGVWSSVSNVDDRKTLEFTSDKENKFTFKSMLETDPEKWETTLEGYDDFVGKYVIFDAETNTLTLRNIRVTGKWVAYAYEDDYRCINLNNNIKHIIMEDSVSLPGNYIPYSAFNCTGLESIVLPKGVLSIGGTVNADDGTEINSDTVWYGAFDKCDSLTSVTIPGSVTEIGTSAFYGCILLTSVTIPGSVTTIGNYAFSYTSLTSVTIPGSVTEIGTSAFYGCESLTSVTIPGSVTTIGNVAFSYCKSLTSVTIDARNSSFDTLEYASFPTELQYIITTGNTMNNYLIGKCLSYNNNIVIPSDDTYHLFEVEYNNTNDANTRRIKSISDVILIRDILNL